MTTRTFTAPAAGPLLFDLQAGAADIVITVSPGTGAATAELSGPDEIVDGTRASGDAGRWSMVLPRPHGTVITGGVQVINMSRGGSVVQATTIHGGISIVGGRVYAGGTEITSAVTVEPTRLDVTLPAGSHLAARVDAGTITTSGDLPEARITTTSADVDVLAVRALTARTISGDITAWAVTGTATLATISGDIRIDDTDGPVSAATTSGDIDITTSSPVNIDTESVSGDINVRTGGGGADVRARSVSGRVRTR